MNKKAISIESLFVMVLFMVFAISIVIMIISGKNSYENILNNKERAESMRISSSYLRVKIFQNKQAEAIWVNHNPDLDVDLLEIKQNGGEYKTVIYYYDGKIWEGYQALADDFDHGISEAVIDLKADQIKFTQTEKGIEIGYVFDQVEMKQFVSFKLEDER